MKKNEPAANHPAATNPAMIAGCHAEGKRRRFVDRNRWANKSLQVVLTAALGLVVVGCTSTNGFPQNPEAARLTPSGFGFLEHAPDSVNTAIYKQARSTFLSFFGGEFPRSLRYKDATGWFTPELKMKQIRAEAKISPEDFQKRLEVLRWREMALPNAELQAMHLPANVPRDYMTCFVGKIDGKPAAAYWSSSYGSLMLVADL